MVGLILVESQEAKAKAFAFCFYNDSAYLTCVNIRSRFIFCIALSLSKKLSFTQIITSIKLNNY
ncbi:MAG: hypothetical protein ED556_09540 [Winogradskyella sp.]|nr:MAG: hypothetical protein ED556_09540 [Winogradskyella sp.]